MKKIYLILAFLCTAGLSQGEERPAKELLDTCAKEAERIYENLFGEIVIAKKISVGSGPYTTEIVYQIGTNILNAYKIKLFQDEEGSGCFLGQIEFVGDL